MFRAQEITARREVVRYYSEATRAFVTNRNDIFRGFSMQKINYRTHVWRAVPFCKQREFSVLTPSEWSNKKSDAVTNSVHIYTYVFRRFPKRKGRTGPKPTPNSPFFPDEFQLIGMLDDSLCPKRDNLIRRRIHWSAPRRHTRLSSKNDLVPSKPIQRITSSSNNPTGSDLALIEFCERAFFLIKILNFSRPASVVDDIVSRLPNQTLSPTVATFPSSIRQKQLTRSDYSSNAFSKSFGKSPNFWFVGCVIISTRDSTEFSHNSRRIWNAPLLL